MIDYLTFRYRIYPTKRQAAKLLWLLEACRWIHNRAVRLRQDVALRATKSADVYKAVREWQREQPFLRPVQAKTVQDICSNASKLRRRDEFQNLCYPQYKLRLVTDWLWPEKPARLWLPSIGRIKIKLHRPVEGEVKRLTLTRCSDGKWFACLLSRVKLPIEMPLTVPDKTVEVGLGDRETNITLSTGESFLLPTLRPQEAKTLERMEHHSRCFKIKRRLKNRRSDLMHKLSHRLVNEFSIIIFDRRVLQSSWAALFKYTRYKAKFMGVRIVVR